MGGSAVDWLLDADPSIRCQVMRDLIGAPADAIAAERARIGEQGWGAMLLDLQRPDGNWGDGVDTPLWWTNLYTLVYLRDLGLDPASGRARAAIDRVRRNVGWGPEFGNAPFFDGEVEPCINGRVAALGAYFGVRSHRLAERLLGEQLPDGGWNCEAERGSVRSSFHTTLCVLEGLLAVENAFGPTSDLTEARTRGHEYLIERRLGGSSTCAIPTPVRRHRGRRGRAESLDHVARAASARLVRLTHRTRSSRVPSVEPEPTWRCARAYIRATALRASASSICSICACVFFTLPMAIDTVNARLPLRTATFA